MSQVVGGKYTVQGPARAGRLGSWHVLSTADGHTRGGLRLEEPGLSDPAAAQRLADAVQTTAQLRLPGLVTVVDQVVDGGYTWLITSNPATPTVAQALASSTAVPAAIAALIATDTGQTLLKLHQAQAAHGDVGAHTVALSPSGAALLAESGYAQAFAGTTAGPGYDTAGWVKLLRELAGANSDAQLTQLLRQAAQQAESTGGSAGLTEALNLLATGAQQLPGFGDRAAVTAFAASIPTGADTVPTADAAPPVTAPGSAMPATSVMPVVPAVVPDNATRLGQRAAEGQRAPSQYQPGRAVAPGAVSGAASVPASPAQPDANLRFGQGVPPAPPAWQLAQQSLAVQKPKRRVWPMIASAVSVFGTLALAAAVVWYLWQQSQDTVAVSKVEVTTSTPLKGKCDVQVDLVGTITTDGTAGIITYEWVRSDGKSSGVLEQSVRKGETSTNVHLYWQFQGRGTLNAKATLRIISPTQTQASKDFTYSCK